MSWTSMKNNMNDSELHKLAECFDSGFFDAITNKSRFVLRNKDKIAHSRRYYLTEVDWDKKKAEWKVTVT